MRGAPHGAAQGQPAGSCVHTEQPCGGLQGARGRRQGVLAPADAEQAVNAGVDGLVVSNHGGRQVRRAGRSGLAMHASADDGARQI